MYFDIPCVLLSTFTLLCVIDYTQAQYEDVRCKCVCASVTPGNHTDNTPDKNRKVFVQTLNNPNSCNCQTVVHPLPEGKQRDDFCARCECKWQRRNTTTIKVVVIIIMCVLGLLVLYMLFLLCLDPLMSRRPRTYMEQRNEEVNLDTGSVTQRIIDDDERAHARARPGALLTRMRAEVGRVREDQAKWKGKVQEQRDNVYSRHNILN